MCRSIWRKAEIRSYKIVQHATWISHDAGTHIPENEKRPRLRSTIPKINTCRRRKHIHLTRDQTRIPPGLSVQHVVRPPAAGWTSPLLVELPPAGWTSHLLVDVEYGHVGGHLAALQPATQLTAALVRVVYQQLSTTRPVRISRKPVRCWTNSRQP